MMTIRRSRSNYYAELLDSSCPDGPFNLALTYQRSRDFEQAIDFYLQAMRLSAMARNPSQVSNEIWARSAATVFPMLNSFSECALIPKPAWMTDPVRLVDVAKVGDDVSSMLQ